jgi:flagellin
MALNSVHTNVSALVALQGLNRTNEQLQATQTRVSSGFRVSSAKEDGASFAIAQGLRGDVRGYEAIQEQLSKAKGTMSIANESARKISDTLGDVRSVMTKLADDNVTGEQRTQYEGDYANLIAEITRFISGAEFNGVNLLNTTTDLNVISTLAGGSLTLNAFDLPTDVTANLTAVTSAVDARAMLAAGGGLRLAETAIANTMAQLGADTKSLDNQYTYVGLLSDATEEGVGAIVDADLAKESAKLQALQIRQQLGTQTLSIANQAPNVLLSLFQQ